MEAKVSGMRGMYIFHMAVFCLRDLILNMRNAAAAKMTMTPPTTNWSGIPPVLGAGSELSGGAAALSAGGFAGAAPAPKAGVPDSFARAALVILNVISTVLSTNSAVMLC